MDLIVLLMTSAIFVALTFPIPLAFIFSLKRLLITTVYFTGKVTLKVG